MNDGRNTPKSIVGCRMPLYGWVIINLILGKAGLEVLYVGELMIGPRGHTNEISFMIITGSRLHKEYSFSDRIIYLYPFEPSWFRCLN